MYFVDFLRQYCQTREIAIQASTRYQYEVAIDCFGLSLGHTPQVEDLTDAAVSRWVDWMGERKYSPSTIVSKRGGLLVLWRAAAAAGLVEPPGRVRGVRKPQLFTRAWTYEEVARLAAVARCQSGRFRGTKISRAIHVEAFISVAWDSALRLADILSIHRSMIDMQGMMMILQSKTQVEHCIQFQPGTLALIDLTLAEQPREQVFPLCRRVYQRRLEKLVDIAHLPQGSIKWLRRSSATDAELQVPGGGTRVLGHTSPDTARHYVDRRQLMRPIRPHALPSAAVRQ